MAEHTLLTLSTAPKLAYATASSINTASKAPTTTRNTTTPKKTIESNWSLWHPWLAHVSEHFTDCFYQVADGIL